MTISWTHAAHTDVGRVRRTNEDAWFADPQAGAFAIADGMGGHAAGEVASRLAVSEVAHRLARLPADAATRDVREALGQGVAAANRAILAEAGKDPRKTGMGTTLTALVLHPSGAWALGHVGDSRAYRLRSSSFQRLTEDHTYVQELVRRGRISDDQARRHPRASVLTRALGTERQVTVDLREGDAAPGDRFLLCSDGLTTMLAEERVASLAREIDDGGRLARALVEEALLAGGSDNITVMVVDVDREPGEADRRPADGEPGPGQ